MTGASSGPGSQGSAPQSATPSSPVGADPSRKGSLYCSFCGVSNHDTLVLVAGPTVLICDKCTDDCAYIVNQHRLQKLVKEAIASAMSASGQDPKGLEAKPASAVPQGDAQTQEPSS